MNDDETANMQSDGSSIRDICI